MNKHLQLLGKHFGMMGGYILNERVRILREYLKLNQREFSNKINISQSTLALMEGGQRSVRDIHVSQIISIFGVSEEWLRTGEGDMFLQSFEIELSELLGELLVTGTERTKDILKEMCKLEDHESELILELLKIINKNK